MTSLSQEYDMFRKIRDGQIDFEDFMSWLARERTNAESRGYKQGSENGYKNSGGFEF